MIARFAAARPGSLRGQLVRWLLVPLLILVAVDAVSVYYNALEAADTAYDRSLLASTRALAERVSAVNGRVTADVPYLALDSFETDTLGRIYYKVTGIEGEFVSGYDDLPPLPADIPRSEAYPALVRFYHADYHDQPVRIAALYQPVSDDTLRGMVLIQVAETIDARRGMTRKLLFDTLWRQGVLVTVAGLLVWFAVRFVLRPLMQLRIDVESRAPTDLSGFNPDRVHKEVRPLVLAMNGYMDRLQTLITGQRRFIADASHQLRTPLTVLKTQSELALREFDRMPRDPRALRELVESIAGTTDATVHLANRLLTLARAGHGAAEGGMTAVSLTTAVRQVALELSSNAVAKCIDLAFDTTDAGDIIVDASPVLLHELIVNLLDNAIRYTPANGAINLRVFVRHAGDDVAGVMEVEDSGAGIAAAERERVFAPFYRAPSAQLVNPHGAGLGMTIVRDIASAHGGAISLSDSRGGRGLLVTVCFPLSIPPQD